jgi:hypothetical protein
MACLRSRVMAGNGRWLHACHCCDAGAPSAPWGAWSWPGATSSSVSESGPRSARSPQRRGIVGCWGGSQQACTSGTRLAQNRHGRLYRLARPQSFDVGDQGVGASFGPFPVVGQGETRRRWMPIAMCCGDGILAHPRDPYVSSAAVGAWAGGRRLDATETGLGSSVQVSRSSGTT